MNFRQDIWLRVGQACLFLAVATAAWNLLPPMRTLWLDEAMLANNWVTRDWPGMLRPLGSSQVAPIGYLLLMEGISTLGNNTVEAFRWPSFAAYLMTLFLLLRGLNKAFPEYRAAAFFAVALFAVFPATIRYAVEIKQYIFDCMVWALCLNAWAEIRSIDPRQKGTRIQAFALVLLGPVAIAFSNVAVSMLFALGVAWIVHVRNLWRPLPTLAFWVGAFGLYYGLFIHDHPTKGFMDEFWSGRDAFAPFDLRFFPWAADTIQGYFKFVSPMHGIPSKLPVVLLFLAAVGSVAWLAKKRPMRTWLPYAVLPGLVHLLISGLHLYPFHSRLALWHLPAMVLLGSGFLVGLGQTWKRPNLAHFALLMLFATQLHFTWKRHPREWQTIQPALVHLDEHLSRSTPLLHTMSFGPSLTFHSRFSTRLKEAQRLPIGSFRTFEMPDAEALKGLAGADTVFFLIHDNIGGGKDDRGQTASEVMVEELLKSGLSADTLFRRDMISLLHFVKQPAGRTGS